MRANRSRAFKEQDRDDDEDLDLGELEHAVAQYTRELDAPFVPVVTDSSDTRNFEDYPDSAGDDPGEGLPKETDAELFGMF